MNVNLTNLQNFRDIDFSALQVKKGQLLADMPPDIHRAYFRKDEIIHIARQSMANLEHLSAPLSQRDRSLVKQIQGEISLLEGISTIATTIEPINESGPVTNQHKEIFEKMSKEAKNTACLLIALKFFSFSELNHIHRFTFFCNLLISDRKSKPIHEQLCAINILALLARHPEVDITVAEHLLYTLPQCSDIEEPEKMGRYRYIRQSLTKQSTSIKESNQLYLCWQITEFLTNYSISTENIPIVCAILIEFIQKNRRFLTKEELIWLSEQIALKPVLFSFCLDNLLTRESKETKIMYQMMAILTEGVERGMVFSLQALQRNLEPFSRLTIFSNAEKLAICHAIYRMSSDDVVLCPITDRLSPPFNLSIMISFLKFILENNRSLTEEEQTWFVNLRYSFQKKALLFLCSILPSSSIRPFIDSLKTKFAEDTEIWLLSILEKSPGWEECSAILQNPGIIEGVFDSNCNEILEILKNINARDRAHKLSITIKFHEMAAERNEKEGYDFPRGFSTEILIALQRLPFVFDLEEIALLNQIIYIENFLKTCLLISKDQVKLLADVYIKLQHATKKLFFSFILLSSDQRWKLVISCINSLSQDTESSESVSSDIVTAIDKAMHAQGLIRSITESDSDEE